MIVILNIQITKEDVKIWEEQGNRDIYIKKE